MSDEAIEIAKRRIGMHRFLSDDKSLEFVLLSQSVLNQSEEIKQLQEAVSSAREALESISWITKYEGWDGNKPPKDYCNADRALCEDWIQKYGLEKE